MLQCDKHAWLGKHSGRSQHRCSLKPCFDHWFGYWSSKESSASLSRSLFQSWIAGKSSQRSAQPSFRRETEYWRGAPLVQTRSTASLWEWDETPLDRDCQTYHIMTAQVVLHNIPEYQIPDIPYHDSRTYRIQNLMRSKYFILYHINCTIFLYQNTFLVQRQLQTIQQGNSVFKFFRL